MKPKFNVNRPHIEGSLRKRMDAVLVSIQVQGGVIANWTDSNERTKELDRQNKTLQDALNIARDASARRNKS